MVKFEHLMPREYFLTATLNSEIFQLISFITTNLVP